MMTIAVTAVNYSKIVLKFYSGDLGWNLYQKVLNRIYEAVEEQNHHSIGSSDSQYFLPFFLEEIALKILSQMIYYYYNFHRIRNDDNDNEGFNGEEDDKSVMTMMN